MLCSSLRVFAISSGAQSLNRRGQLIEDASTVLRSDISDILLPSLIITANCTEYSR